MAQSNRGSSQHAKTSDHPRPEVIVDFVFENGLLFVVVSNIGARPALDVTVRFDKSIRTLGGGRISSLDLKIQDALITLRQPPHRATY